MEFILASASSRRKNLFAKLVEDFEVVVSNFKEENVIEDMLPKKLVKVLAAGKAKDVLTREGNEGKIVIGADTVVTYNNEILGKPRRDSEAVEMLKTLSGTKHIVYTGVCIAFMEKGEIKTLSCVDKTVVYFETLTDEFIKEYVASGSPRDKAGAYGIQDGNLVKGIKGSYTNVVGLPLEKMEKLLAKLKKRLEKASK